jgi:stage V sporulation protein G
MNITEVRLTKLENNKALALASITIDKDFVVSGLAIYNGQNGMWVSMPSRKNKDGEYHDIAFPITKQAREEIRIAVLNKYDDKPFNDQDSEDVYNEIKKGEEKAKYEDVDPDDLPF